MPTQDRSWFERKVRELGDVLRRLGIAEDRAGMNPDREAWQTQKKTGVDRQIQKAGTGPEGEQADDKAGKTTLNQSIDAPAGDVNLTILRQGDDASPSARRGSIAFSHDAGARQGAGGPLDTDAGESDEPRKGGA